MHHEAMQWVTRHATTKAVRVLDIGGRDINGTPRDLFPNATEYTVVDLRPGPNVDIVADVRHWKPRRKFDITICCEVLEHTQVWRDILAAAATLTKQGGRLIVTAAGPGREPHSAEDGSHLRDGEHYENIQPRDLLDALTDWAEVDIDQHGTDVRAVATR